MKTLSLRVDEAKLEEITTFYDKYRRESKDQYIIFDARKDSLRISAYQNKQGKQIKVVFYGEDVEREAQRFFPDCDIKELIKTSKTTPKTKNKNKSSIPPRWLFVGAQIGSDEVGTSDFFAPICVCAVYLDKDDIALLSSLGVQDSKKLDDAYIWHIGPTLTKKFTYSLVCLNNEKYNQLIAKGHNLDSIKAILHNQVLLNIKKKHPAVKDVFVDQFTKEKLYYLYIALLDDVVRPITFKTKGEMYYPSIALASCIARYRLLKEMNDLNKKYGITFPLGVVHIKDFAQRFITKYGQDEFARIVKKDFATYEQIIAAEEVNK